MLHGDQLRHAARLLGWGANHLAGKTGVSAVSILDELCRPSRARLEPDEEQRVRAVLGRHGIMILDRRRNDLGVYKLPR